MEQGPSQLRRLLEKVVLKVLCAPGIVWVSWRVLRPFARIMPMRFLHLFVGKIIAEQRLSLTGAVTLSLPGGEPFRMLSAADPVATLSDWGGWKGYEEDLMLVFPALMTQVRTFINAGANTGMYILAAGALDANILAIAVEPQVTVFQRLEDNVRLNNRSNVQCLRLALAEQEGEVTLFEGDGALPIGSSIADADSYTWSHAQSVVPATTLDALVVDYGLTDVDLVLMDIEGAEPGALRGGPTVLATHRPILVCEVLSDAAGRELEEVLEDKGYRYFHLTYEGPREATAISGEVVLRNWLFLPHEKTSQVLDAVEKAGIRTSTDVESSAK